MGAMMATAATGFFGKTVGDAAGDSVRHLLPASASALINGFGVAYLRAPSMIFTLGMNAVAQGLMVVHTGGFSPQDPATPLMRELVVGHGSFRAFANPILIWLVLGIVTVFILTRTTLGRQIYAIGNRERAVFLSGVDTRRVLVICFVIFGGCAAAGGVLLAGWANRSYPGDGRPLPAADYRRRRPRRHQRARRPRHLSRHGRRGDLHHPAAVDPVGRAAAVLLAEIGLKMPPETIRQIVFGVVIVGMLLLYGREKLIR